MITIGTFTMKIDPHQKCSSRNPPVIGPSPMPSAETPAHTPIALPRSAGSVKTLVMIESVDGMMNARADAHQRAGADEHVGRRREGREQRADAEDGETDRQEAVAAEPVTEASRGEQQAGEHQRVGVDDPLQLAGRRPEAALALGWARVGSATLRIVLSSVITIRLMQRTSSVSHRRL